MTTFSQQTLTHWRHDAISFIQQCLRDPEIGKPFKLLDAERRFLAHAFQLGSDGRLLYPEQVYSCPKKSGKTTFAAIKRDSTAIVTVTWDEKAKKVRLIAHRLFQPS
jgi:hypothetical protein